MGKFPIETDRLVLRPFKLSDANDYFKMTQDSDIQEYVSYACTDTIEETREDILDYYSKGDLKHDYYIVIECKEMHKMIGAFIVTQNADSEFDFCIMIAKEERRKGYITEATKAFIPVFPSKSVLQFVIRNDNEASLKSVAKIENLVECKSIVNKQVSEKYYYRVFKYIVQ